MLKRAPSLGLDWNAKAKCQWRGSTIQLVSALMVVLMEWLSLLGGDQMINKH